jgi:Ca2+-transporting ATPase
MNFNETKDSIIKRLDTNELTGLTTTQASDVLHRDGLNELKEGEKDSLLIKFINQFKDPLTLILIAAAIISIVVDPHEWVDSLIIVIVVVFNAILGLYQENNAEQSLEALKKMASPNAKVIRNGQKQTIPSNQVVKGDLLVIEAGDFIASDARIVESYNCQIDESALTGESLPVTKISDVIVAEEVALGDQKNMVFSSTVCTYGRATAIVISTGMENEVGKIAGMLNATVKETTPLQIKLAELSKIIGYMCIGICVVVFGLEVYQGLSYLDAFKTAVALAVAAIPEGLATVVTIVLALGVTKMVKKNAIVRKLPAVETLGSCSIICSDKTGTLTQNKMTVVKTFINEVKEFDGEGSDDIRTMMKYFTMCSDGEIRKNKDGSVELIGDPTETALVYASYRLGDTKEEFYNQYKRTDELAFDSERKMMSVFYKNNGKILQVTKGAPDIIISNSLGDNSTALDANEEMANQALRVLAVAYKVYDSMPSILESKQQENDMHFVGLVGMIDPARLEVKPAILEAKKAGIKTIMITGDHLTTAKAIALNLNIFQEGDLAITGAQLNEMDDQELKEKIKNITVYARVAPEHKVRIVKMWQQLDQVVAMTGDGVNDAPALKTADIGCAMGITGTDVSKNAADIILTDDNFATIIAAVREGRGIYSNIKKDVQFLLSSNIGEVITIFGASIISLFGFNLGVPLLPIHLLWVNLITDSLPAFALGMEKPDDDIMFQKPRNKNESFFAGGLGTKIIWQGMMIGTITLTSYIIGNNVDHSLGMTMAFLTLSLAQLVHSFNVKSNSSILNKSLFDNKYLWYSFLVGVILQALIINVPSLASLFRLTALSMQYASISIGLAFVPLVVVEIIKFFNKKRD